MNQCIERPELADYLQGKLAELRAEEIATHVDACDACQDTVVELAATEDIYGDTLHPYTQALLSAIPVADLNRRSHRIVLEGDVPSPVEPPSGCPFHPRCPKAFDRCKTDVPSLKKHARDGRDRFVACHLVDDDFGG